jgi:hypothetical protein
MNQSLDALIGSMRRALREEILPELSSDHARSQLAGVLDVLGKIESMVVWSPDVVREQLDLLEGCLSQGVERLHAMGHAAPAGLASTAPQAPASQADLQAALADAERRVCQLIDWVFAAPGSMPAAHKDELHDMLRTALRNTLKAQRRVVPSADFSSMTAPRHPAGEPGDCT